MKTIIYSHGFGVDKTDRGLFTDIANVFESHNHIMFDYNKIDKENNQMTVTALDEQAEKLRQTIANEKGDITVIAHSQGCVVAAMVAPDSVKNIIFLAPPYKFDNSSKKAEKLFQREGVEKDKVGNILLPRRDGSTTIISQAYFDSREGLNPIDLYNQLSIQTKLTIFRATEDEVLESTDIDGLDSGIKIVDISTDHNFTGESRNVLIQSLNELL